MAACLIKHINDREHLFLNIFYSPRVEEGGAISSFFVRAAVYFAFFGDNFKSGASVNTPNSDDKASQTTESDTILNIEAEAASLNESVPKQTSSSMVAAEPPDLVVVDNEDRQELESLTAMVLALSSDGETIEVS